MQLIVTYLVYSKTEGCYFVMEEFPNFFVTQNQFTAGYPVCTTLGQPSSTLIDILGKFSSI